MVTISSTLWLVYFIRVEFQIQGHVHQTQGWVLRRCLSTINRICGRPYRPRDLLIRRLCEAAGVVWPEPETEPRDENNDDDGDDENLEEASESEMDATDDEEVPVGRSLLLTQTTSLHC